MFQILYLSCLEVNLLTVLFKFVSCLASYWKSKLIFHTKIQSQGRQVLISFAVLLFKKMLVLFNK